MKQQSKNNVCLFVRVSMDNTKQSYDRQITELKLYCEQTGHTITNIIATHISGTKTEKDRPDLKELFDSARKKEFNKVMVSELSRLGRNAKDIRHTIDTLHNLKIPIIFRNLGGMESLDEAGNESFVTNIIIAIYGEMAQEERRLLSERVKSALNQARANGKILGRLPGTVKSEEKLLKEYSKLVTDLKKGMSLNKCVKLHDVSKNTVIKVKRAMIKNNEMAVIDTEEIKSCN